MNFMRSLLWTYGDNVCLPIFLGVGVGRWVVFFYGWKESGMLILNLFRALRQSVYHLVSFHVGFRVCLWGDGGHPKKTH